jgi:alpha-beta hydrolase superfamily lysophospholipase
MTVVWILTSGGAAIASGRPVTFQSRDGTVLSGLFYETARPAPGIVLVHMLGRSKEDWSSVAERLQESGATVLAFDLRGHGGSGGSQASLGGMAGDVAAALEWLASRSTVHSRNLAVVGASLGANVAAIAAADNPAARAVALVSPSLDYRGVRLDAALMKRLADRAVWFAASTEDPYALRTIKELIAGGSREQHLSGVRAHGTALVAADPDVAQALVDWLRRTLIF